MLHLLVIDDNPNDRLLAIRELRREFADLTINEILDADDLTRALAMGDFDAAVTDFQLHWTDGLAVLRTIKARFPEKPVIMFTNTGTEEVAVEAMKAGLDDYVIKAPNRYLRLPSAVRTALERANKQQRLAQLELRLETLLNQLNVGIFRATPNGQLLESNPAFLRLLGVPALQPLSTINLLELGVMQSLAAAELSTPTQYEVAITQATGETVWLLVQITQQLIGATPIINGLAEDITARTLIEQERAASLRREQAARSEAEAAVRARDEFLAIAAHELKTPITSLRGYAQLLLRRVDQGQSVDLHRLQRALQAIDQQSDKLSQLIERLLDLSRIEAGNLHLNLQRLNLTALVHEVMTAMQATTDRHSLSLDAPVPIEVIGDALRLEQVLTNLLSNAIKFSPQGGPIKLAIVEQPSTVEVRVTDWGIGIEPEAQQRIFERLYQANTHHLGGLGLGLYISQQIMTLHKGTIHAEFPAEGGTCFVLQLPTGNLHAVGTVL